MLAFRRTPAHTRGRILRFAAVGAIGTIVNLGTMSLLIRGTGIRDWRASAASTFVAIFSNYLLNNSWTFGDRSRRGRDLATGYCCYLAVSLAALGLTTAAYTAIVAGARRSYVAYPPDRILLLAQLASIAFGSFANYALNAAITWRKPHRVDSVEPAVSEVQAAREERAA